MPIPFGRYELLKRIAAGGMGEVYLARQVGPDGFEKLLVVKVLLQHLADDQEFINMFKDEAKMVARLIHPNVAQVNEFEQFQGHWYIAMEYVHGEDVVRLWKEARKQDKRVPLPLVVRIAAEAAAGLDFAHKTIEGMVHRDISPQNILVTFEGGVKLIDFGVAKAVGRSVHTQTGTLKGKYSYMSPEQAAGKEIDHRSDVFSLGVVLYEMATSFRLFKRDTDMATLRAVSDCRVPQPSDKNPEIDEALEAIILRALAKEPDDRYADAAELRLDLEDWLLQTRQSGSTAHLAAFMREVYAERLAQEKTSGKPYPDFEGTPSGVLRGPGNHLMESRGSASAGFTGGPTAPAPSSMKWAVVAAVALGLGAAGYVGWTRLAPAATLTAVGGMRPTLSVISTPPGATVRLNGSFVGLTPLAGQPLDPSRFNDVDVELVGHRVFRKTIAGDKPEALEVKLEAEPQAAPDQVSLTLMSEPAGAAVYLGDKLLGSTPLPVRQERSDNALTFQFRLHGYRAAERTFTPKEDGEVRAVLTRLVREGGTGHGTTTKDGNKGGPLDIKIDR